MLLNSRVIPIKDRNEPINSAIRSVNALGFRRFSTFLATLPGLSKCLGPVSDGDIPWPSFNGDAAEGWNKPVWESGRSRQRERETCLLNGVVEGLEVSFDELNCLQCYDSRLTLIVSSCRHRSLRRLQLGNPYTRFHRQRRDRYYLRSLRTNKSATVEAGISSFLPAHRRPSPHTSHVTMAKTVGRQ